MRKLFLFLVCFSFFFSEIFSQNLITYSSNSDTLFCGKKITFKKTNPNDTLAIFYSLDDGKTWTKITDDFENSFEWEIPFTLKKKIFFKTRQYKIEPLRLLWDVPNAHQGEVRSVDFSQNGKLLLTLGKDGLIKVWDILQRKAIDSIKISGTDYYYDAKFLKDPNKVVFTLHDRIVLWNRQNKSTDIFYTIGNFIRKIDLNPTNNNFSIITDDVNLAVFNETFFLPIPINTIPFSKSQYANAYDIKYAPDGRQVVISTYNGRIIITNGQNELSYKVDNKPIYSATFTNQTDLLAFGGASNQLFFYKRGGDVIPVEPKFGSFIREIKFNSARNEVYVGSLDSSIRIWSTRDLSYVPYYLKEPFGILSLDLTQSGDTIATAGRFDGFRVWQNYRNIGETQIDTFICLQEIYLSVENGTDKILPRELIKFKFFAESKFKDTLQKIGTWNIQSKITFPFRSLSSNFYEKYLRNTEYVVPIDTLLRFKSEHIDEWTFRTLYNNQEQEKIGIQEIKIIPEDNFFPIVIDGKIIVSYGCQTQTKLTIEPIPKIQRFEVANNSINIEFDVDVLSKYDIFVTDYFGRMPKLVRYNTNPKLITIEGVAQKLLIIKFDNKINQFIIKVIIN